VLGAVGLRILAGAGLGRVEAIQYLALWYTAGLLLPACAFYGVYRRLERKDVVIVAAMAVCSLICQAGMAFALSGGLPGYVVFPVATGGGLIFVVMVGVLLFREPMGPLGYLGIATGVCALVLLALPA